MTAAGSRPSRTGRVAAPDCLTYMCHHVHAADQRDLYLALLQTNDLARLAHLVQPRIGHRFCRQRAKPGPTLIVTAGPVSTAT